MVSSFQEMLPKLVYIFVIFHVLIICVQLVWSLIYYTNIIKFYAVSEVSCNFPYPQSFCPSI